MYYCLGWWLQPNFMSCKVTRGKVLNTYLHTKIQRREYRDRRELLFNTIQYNSLLFTTIHNYSLLFTTIHYYSLLTTTIHYYSLLFATIHYFSLLSTTMYYYHYDQYFSLLLTSIHYYSLSKLLLLVIWWRYSDSSYLLVEWFGELACHEVLCFSL
jgi:hypothetical protein